MASPPSYLRGLVVWTIILWIERGAGGFYFPNTHSAISMQRANTAVQREEKGVEQIELEQDDSALKKLYEEECAKNGVKVDIG